MFTIDERLLAVVMPHTNANTNPSANPNLNPNCAIITLKIGSV